MAARDRIHIYQIYYNDETRAQLDPGYIPLDNSQNARPDWYEFWPIRNFLKAEPLRRGHWYGFLSPSFGTKTTLSSEQVFGFVEAAAAVDVALLSPGWDQIAYFQNLFEQGDYWHPGLLALSQEFLRQAGVRISLKRLVTHSLNSVFSNYFVARAEFWIEWLELADQFFDYAETHPEAMAETAYRGRAPAPMKTFVQERFASLILSAGGFSIAALDRSGEPSMPTPWLFDDNRPTRRTLAALDFLKQKFVEREDEFYLAAFRKIRSEMKLAKGARPA